MGSHSVAGDHCETCVREMHQGEVLLCLASTEDRLSAQSSEGPGESLYSAKVIC